MIISFLSSFEHIHVMCWFWQLSKNVVFSCTFGGTKLLFQEYSMIKFDFVLNSTGFPPQRFYVFMENIPLWKPETVLTHDLWARDRQRKSSALLCGGILAGGPAADWFTDNRRKRGWQLSYKLTIQNAAFCHLRFSGKLTFNWNWKRCGVFPTGMALSTLLGARTYRGRALTNSGMLWAWFVFLRHQGDGCVGSPSSPADVAPHCVITLYYHRQSLTTGVAIFDQYLKTTYEIVGKECIATDFLKFPSVRYGWYFTRNVVVCEVLF